MNVITLVVFAQGVAASPSSVIRVNQLGYLPDAPKVAVFCSLGKIELHDFAVTNGSGRNVLQRPATSAKPFGPCSTNYRLDFSSLKRLASTTSRPAA